MVLNGAGQNNYQEDFLKAPGFRFKLRERKSQGEDSSLETFQNPPQMIVMGITG